MTSALRPGGSTSAWRKLRSIYATTLPRPCARCGLTVEVVDAWDLDHLVARADGGDDDTLGVSHSSCNRRAGNLVGRRLTPVPYRSPQW